MRDLKEKEELKKILTFLLEEYNKDPIATLRKISSVYYYNFVLEKFNHNPSINDAFDAIEIFLRITKKPIPTFPICTRVEVIDQKGRSYVNWYSKNIVKLSFQDEGKTLKVFIDERKSPDPL